MKNIIKYILLCLMFTAMLEAAPARGGMRTFTQPDGTTFQAELKGDAAFHWLESSDARVVLYNPKDKFYYYATVDATKGGFKRTQERAISKREQVTQAMSYQKSQDRLQKGLSQEDREMIRRLQRASRVGNYPR